VARANGERVGAARTAWVAAAGLSAFRVDRPFDAIVCNPPYVAESERAALPREVVEWEPAEALFAGPAGTESITEVVREAPRYLAPGGLLAMEIGRGQDREVRRLVEDAAGLEFLAEYSDFSGVARGVLALAPEGEV
jgi:release factor glutamine methyltransferase